jgi:hypothetical protein
MSRMFSVLFMQDIVLRLGIEDGADVAILEKEVKFKGG